MKPMKRSTRWMIVFVYYISQLVGMLAFSYDFDTGVTKTTFLITFYSCLISFLMFCSLPLLTRIQWKPRNANGPELHFKITALISLIRILAILLTDFQHLRKDLLNKFVMSKKVEQNFEKAIIYKGFYWGLMSNITIGLGFMATVLNIVMTHYFFALVNINALLAVINEELKKILNTSMQLFKLQRAKQIKPGVFTTTCCKLADKLDILAINQYNLQNIGVRVNSMYELQGACIVLTMYMNNISVIYMGYMLVQHEQLSQDYGIIVLFLIPISLLFYYMDLKIFIINMLNFGDLIKTTANLLQNRQPCLPSLDVRFEKSIFFYSGNMRKTMKRSTRWMIICVYYISQLLGIVAFSYNYDTGKLKTTFSITLYSCLVSALMFCSIALIPRIQWKPRNANGPELHFKITALMCLVRIIAVLISVILNWIKRKEFIKNIKDFQNLRTNLLKKYVMSTKVQKYFEKSIRDKFYWGLMSNIMVFASSYDILRGIFDLESPLIITGLGTMSTVLNILMTHHFFALLNVNAHLAVVNEELRRILNTSSVLFKLQRLKKIKPGALITTCCNLTDELDDLAFYHYKFKLIGERVQRLYDLQGACVMLTLYMNNINVLYMGYMIVQHEELSQELGVYWTSIIVGIVLYFFYKDLHLFIINMLNFGDNVQRTADLLRNRQPWLPTLDERFEKIINKQQY
ncbi:putative gustatory receptor 59d [Lucilia cuprina]|nr:putative gustatory receptor 59d [Lucilia cuprina]